MLVYYGAIKRKIKKKNIKPRQIWAILTRPTRPNFCQLSIFDPTIEMHQSSNKYPLLHRQALVFFSALPCLTLQMCRRILASYSHEGYHRRLHESLPPPLHESSRPHPQIPSPAPPLHLAVPHTTSQPDADHTAMDLSPSPLPSPPVVEWPDVMTGAVATD